MFHRGLYRFAQFTVAAAFFVIFAGASVTSTDSGMAVPDWPQSFGSWNPKMEGGVFYEHGHRVVAGATGVLVLILALWAASVEKRRGARWIAWSALIAIIVQGTLGGLTVLIGTWNDWSHTSPLVSPIHATLAQGLFCLLVAFAVLSSPGWLGLKKARLENPAWRRHAHWLLMACFAQIILGAAMRHQRVGLIIPDFPLSYGSLLPEFHNWHVALNFSHRTGGWVVAFIALGLSRRILKGSQNPWLRRPAAWLAAAVAIQFMLGASSVWSGLKPWATVPHVAGGSLVLTLSLLILLRLRRIEEVAAA